MMGAPGYPGIPGHMGLPVRYLLFNMEVKSKVEKGNLFFYLTKPFFLSQLFEQNISYIVLTVHIEPYCLICRAYLVGMELMASQENPGFE